jgi:hypothetical protein
MASTSRTDAYRFTVQSLDDPRLADLRKEVALRNRSVPWSEPHEVSWKDVPVRSRTVEEVKVHARLGKDSPHREKYRTLHGRMNTQHVALEHGSYFDVYVHTRFRDREEPGWTPPKPVPVDIDDVEAFKASFEVKLAALVETFEQRLGYLPIYREGQARAFAAKKLAEATARVLG